MATSDMRRFWDARAAENPFYYVDNRLTYSDPDLEAFWASGVDVVDGLVARLAAPEIDSSQHVVEIGCGVGRITRILAARCQEVHAFDVSEEMIRLARELNPGLTNVEWIVGDGVSLRPLRDGVADVCYSDVVFQHIPDPEITLGYVEEIGRVLRPGGWAVFQISNDPALHARRSPRARLRARLLALTGRGPRGQGHPAWLGSAVAMGDLQARAATAGLEIVRSAGEGTQYCHIFARKPG